MSNIFYLKRGLVKGYDIGMGNDLLYCPVPDRGARTRKKYKGMIAVHNVDGKTMTIKTWAGRLKEETFQDRDGRGSYKIGYFIWSPKKVTFKCVLCGEDKTLKYRSEYDINACVFCKP